MLDRLQRPLRDLRISVTDRCNFRCGYCMPADRRYQFMPRHQLLSFEEITTISKVFASFGVTKLRLTGGEPLLRKDLPLLLKMLSDIEGIKDIALTTNGFLLSQSLSELIEAGLSRITVSLDSLNPETFAQLSGRNVDLAVVLKAIDEASAAGLPIKANMVVQRGINDDEILQMLAWFRQRGHTLRFIEFMDVGNVNQWQMERVVSGKEILDRINTQWPCEPLEANYSGEVARRYRFSDGVGEFGLITSVTQPFCGSCSRARISADGELFTCLFGTRGHDLRQALRDQGPAEVARIIAAVWGAREDRYSEQRGRTASREKVEMFKIGG